MRWFLSTLFLLMLMTLAALPVGAAESLHTPICPKSSTMLGRVENVGVDEANTTLKARIDTGAGISSLDARNIRILPGSKDKSHQNVRFEVTTASGKDITLTRPLIEWGSIKLKKSKKYPNGGVIKRPVVRLDLCLGDKVVEGRVNLADRSHMIYPLLIGRNTLKTGDYIVNAKRKFVHKKGCN
jgi:hypothetical protein